MQNKFSKRKLLSPKIDNKKTHHQTHEIMAVNIDQIRLIYINKVLTR
jgi:hypothetical protein